MSTPSSSSDPLGFTRLQAALDGDAEALEFFRGADADHLAAAADVADRGTLPPKGHPKREYLQQMVAGLTQ